MNMSPQARASLVEAFEGFRASAYRDSVGVLTIGFGHTSMAGEPHVAIGMTITKNEADEILSRDLGTIEAAVTKLLRRAPLQHEFDAMADLAYNIGCGNFRSSSVLRYFNRGDAIRAADAFLLWNRAGGRYSAGLARRRQAEKIWFQGTPPSTVMAQDDNPAATAKPVDHHESLLRRTTNRVELALRRGKWIA